MGSTGAYSPDKAAAHPDRLKILREGGNPYPVHLHLIISDLCNLDCPGCAYRMSGYTSNQLFRGEHGERNPNRMLDTLTVRQVLSDCASMGTKAVEFTGGGEPTVHPDARDLIEYAQNLALDTALITNGLLLGKRDLFTVAARTVWTRISIDAATEQVYGAVRPGLGGSHGENLRMVLRNMETLRNVRDTAKTPMTLGAGFVVQRENWHELYEAVRLYREWGADNVRISGLFTPAGDQYHLSHYEAARDLEARAIRDFDSDGFRVYGRFAEKVGDLHGPPDYPTCHYQRFTTYIGGDGAVYRCCVTSYNRQGFLGKLSDFQGSLRSLWDDTVIRARLDHFDARTCERCQFNDRNRAIARLIANPDAVVPTDVLHPTFV
jgi:MoaA/NifB/PqqE/SkfB family radical SAM enzyme